MTLPTTRTAHRTWSGEHGQLVALFAIALFTLLLFVSLSVNVGQAVVRRHQAQMLADTGALAGAAVQARGLNQMTRVNAASLRLFNVFQLRSRIGGYHAMRLPVLASLRQLLGAVPDRTEIVSGTDKEGVNRVDINTSRGNADRVLGHPRIIDAAKKAGYGPSTGDDASAFAAMEPWFQGFRTYMKVSNHFWELYARKTAQDVTLANIRTLVSDRAWRECRRPLASCMRPLVNLRLSDAQNALEKLKQKYADDLKNSKDDEPGEITDWIKSLGNKQGAGALDLLLDIGIPGLIREFENPDGDILVVRYWTDMTPGEKLAFRGAVAGAVTAVASFFVTPLLAPALALKVDFWLARLIEIESWLRVVSAPTWHDMHVTLHRKREDKAEDQAKQDTRFTFWVKLPTTGPSMNVLYPFSDLPEMTAVAVAKPVGGNFGDYPRARMVLANKLEKGAGQFLVEIGEKLAGVVNTLFPESEHVYGQGDYATRRVQLANGEANQADEGSGYKMEDGSVRLSEVFTADELAKMRQSPAKNLFWYYAPHNPYYEPRLVPFDKVYLEDLDLDLSDEQKKRLLDFYAGPGVR